MDRPETNTPEKLYQAIGQFLQNVYSDEDLKTFYNDARARAHSILVTYPVLLPVPGWNNDPLDGLQDIREWCVSADKIIDDILGTLRPQDISETVSLFKKLRIIANNVLHEVNSEQRERIKNERTEKLEREYDRRMKELKEKMAKLVPGISSPLVFEAQVRAQVLKEMGFIMPGDDNDMVQAYLSEDPTFNDRLSQIREKICPATEKINELAGNNTTTGRSLDLYCRLKDIPLEQQFEEVGYALGLTNLHDVIFGKCSRLYQSIDRVIETLEVIQTKTKQGTLPTENGQDDTQTEPQEKEGQGSIDKNEKLSGSWLWRLYETTLKVLVDAFLERFWPNPK